MVDLPVPAPTEKPVASRKVGRKGLVSFAGVRYRAGAWLAGETVQVTCERGLVQLHHRGELIVTHARRHRPEDETKSLRWGTRSEPEPIPEPVAARPSATAVSVTRKVDTGGSVSFAGTHYRVGSKYKRRQVQVAVVGDTVEITIGNKLIRSHPARHDRTREHGALANPGGRPHRINAA
ncbi:MAG: Mu transposase domain-containing protein [Acidimicrobiales bacterium]